MVLKLRIREVVARSQWLIALSLLRLRHQSKWRMVRRLLHLFGVRTQVRLLLVPLSKTPQDFVLVMTRTFFVLMRQGGQNACVKLLAKVSVQGSGTNMLEM